MDAITSVGLPVFEPPDILEVAALETRCLTGTYTCNPGEDGVCGGGTVTCGGGC